MSECIICKNPVPRFRGNWNGHRTPLCKNTNCKRARKTQLQRIARRHNKAGIKPMEGWT